MKRKYRILRTANYIVQKFLPDEKYEEYRMIVTNNHRIVLGFRNKVKNRHSDYGLVSIWHPLTGKCRFRENLKRNLKRKLKVEQEIIPPEEELKKQEETLKEQLKILDEQIASAEQAIKENTMLMERAREAKDEATAGIHEAVIKAQRLLIINLTKTKDKLISDLTKKKVSDFEIDLTSELKKVIKKHQDKLDIISYISIMPAFPTPRITIRPKTKVSRHFIVLLEGDLPVLEGNTWTKKRMTVAFGYESSGGQASAMFVANLHNAFVDFIKRNGEKMQKERGLLKLQDEYKGNMPLSTTKISALTRQHYLEDVIGFEDSIGAKSAKLESLLLRLLPPDWKIKAIYIKGDSKYKDEIDKNFEFNFNRKEIREPFIAFGYEEKVVWTVGTRPEQKGR